MKKYKKIKKNKILLFSNELNTLLKSGMTFSISLKILIAAESDVNFKRILQSINRDINIGNNIFNSFKKFKNIFGENFIYMLKIGELTGNITNSFDNISLYLEYSLENKKKIIGFLIYPAIVFSLSILILSFLLVFILPNFINIFEENKIKLPFITRVLIFISNNFLNTLSSIFVLILFFILIFNYVRKNKNLNFKKDKFILNIFIYGNLIKLSLAGEIYYTLYILLNSGISLVDGIGILSNNIKNSYIKGNLISIKEDLLSGKKISSSLKKLNLYNERFQSFIQVGEESGFLSDTFLEISKILRKEYEYNLKKYIALIEPLSIIFLGSIITFIVLSIYLPIFSLTDIF